MVYKNIWTPEAPPLGSTGVMDSEKLSLIWFGHFQNLVAVCYIRCDYVGDPKIWGAGAPSLSLPRHVRRVAYMGYYADFGRFRCGCKKGSSRIGSLGCPGPLVWERGWYAGNTPLPRWVTMPNFLALGQTVSACV